jgi:hypothetical protein
MSVAARTEPHKLSDAEVVEAYLTASMIPDPDGAAAYMKPGTVIRADRPASTRGAIAG